MSKHTPGPWLIREPDNGIYDTDDDIANVVARGPYGLITIAEEVDVADARLIAAAPELLEALTGLLNEIEGLMGESDGVAGFHLNGDIAPWPELAEGGRFERLSSLSAAHAAIARATGQPAP